MRKKSNVIAKAKVAPILNACKNNLARENIPARARSRSQTPKEEAGCVISGPKALQENKLHEVEAKDNQNLSSKEKVLKEKKNLKKLEDHLKLLSDIVVS